MKGRGTERELLFHDVGSEAQDTRDIVMETTVHCSGIAPD